MQASSLSYINSKLKARLSNRLKEKDLKRLLDQNTLLEALAILKNSSYKTIYDNYLQTGSLKSAEKAMNEEEFALLRTLKTSLVGTERNFIRSLLIYLEVKNLKNLLRNWFAFNILKRDVLVNEAFISTNLVHEIEFAKIYNAKSLSDIITILGNTPYGKLLDDLHTTINEQSSLYNLEIALDLFATNKIFSSYHMLSGENYFFASSVLGLFFDLENLLAYIRFNNDSVLKAELTQMPYVRSSTNMQDKFSLALLSKDKLSNFLDDYYPNLSKLFRQETKGTLLAQLEKSFHVEREIRCKNLLLKNPNSIATIMAYFFFTQNDVAKITSILEAKLYGFSKDTLEIFLC